MVLYFTSLYLKIDLKTRTALQFGFAAITQRSLPRTQARSSGFESHWDFGSALGIMGKAKRKTRLADYDFKMAESKLCKTRGKEKKAFRVFFSEGKVHQLIPKDKIPCPHSSCEMDPQFFERNGIAQHFHWYANVRSWM